MKTLRPIFFIILLGFLLRTYKIHERFIFGPEQSISLWPIVRLFEEKKLPLIGVPLANYQLALFRAPFFIYIFALPLKLVKFSPLGLGIFFIFISLAVIWIIYLSTKILFDKKTALLASFLYASNVYLINADRNVWNYTPIIFCSSLASFLLIIIFKKKKANPLFFFLIGCLAGLNFSFHFQAVIMTIILGWLFLRKKGFKNTLIYFAGIGLFLSPLIIFNLRHNFIMLHGIKKLISTPNIIVRETKTPRERLDNGLRSFSDLLFSLLNLPISNSSLLNKGTIFFIFFLLPGYYLFQKNNSRKKRDVISYFFLSSFLSLIVLIFINRRFYVSTAFYLWFLIPLFVIIWAKFLLSFTGRFKLLGAILLISYIFSNFYLIFTQKPGNYQHKLKIIDYVFTQTKQKPFSLKFINQDVLSYDYLFYYRAPFYGLKYDNINLVEQWNQANPNIFIIHGEYDWQEDKYQIKPFSKMADFSGVKVIIK